MLVTEILYCNLLKIYPKFCCSNYINVHFTIIITKCFFTVKDIISIEQIWVFFRSELDNMAEKQICDVVGILVFVGRVQRSKKKGKLLKLKVKKSISVISSVSIYA